MTAHACHYCPLHVARREQAAAAERDRESALYYERMGEMPGGYPTLAARLLAACEHDADEMAEYDDYSRLPRR